MTKTASVSHKELKTRTRIFELNASTCQHPSDPQELPFLFLEQAYGNLCSCATFSFIGIGSVSRFLFFTHILLMSMSSYKHGKMDREPLWLQTNKGRPHEQALTRRYHHTVIHSRRLEPSRCPSKLSNLWLYLKPPTNMLMH